VEGNFGALVPWLGMGDDQVHHGSRGTHAVLADGGRRITMPSSPGHVVCAHRTDTIQQLNSVSAMREGTDEH
jgi:hypothetical protein